MSCVPWYDPTKPRVRDLVARFEKETGDRFDLNVTFAYEAVEIAADAIKRAGSNDPAAIHAALKATNIADHVAFGGPIQFNAKGQNPNIGGVMLQNQGAKPLVVLPEAARQAKPIFPLVPFDRR
jgi:branched-chain amino acid transport system substrate-binding protein